MPTLRILGDGRAVYATPGQGDWSALPTFTVGSSETVKMTLDYTAWLGGDTIFDSAWTVNGGTSGTETISGAVVTVLINTPTSPVTLASNNAGLDYAGGMVVTVGHTVVSGDRRVKRLALRLAVMPAVVTPSLVTDVGVWA